MLKIKDNVDLKEFYRYGFKRKYYSSTKSLVLEYETKDQPHKYQDIMFDITTRKLVFCNWGSEVMFDLIKADLVEKVDDKKWN